MVRKVYGWVARRIGFEVVERSFFEREIQAVENLWGKTAVIAWNFVTLPVSAGESMKSGRPSASIAVVDGDVQGFVVLTLF